MPVLGVLGISTITSHLFAKLLAEGLLSSALIVVVSMSIAILAIYFIGLNRYWRKRILVIFASQISKMRLN